MVKVDSAIILAAGASSRFAPISYEIPKGLVEVHGEKMVERIIKQLKEKDIENIIIVVGYKKEQYYYLKNKFNVKILENTDFDKRNNSSSIYIAQNYIKNSYIIHVDNYFTINPFKKHEDESYYAALYSDDYTDEWCVKLDENDYITDVKIGDSNSWYMAGHIFWNEAFSKEFIRILNEIYNKASTYNKFWEDIYVENMDILKMKVKKFKNSDIKEFDSLNELREFDKNYIIDTRSKIVKYLCEKLNCKEQDILNFRATKNGLIADGFNFELNKDSYHYDYETKQIKMVKKC